MPFDHTRSENRWLISSVWSAKESARSAIHGKAAYIYMLQGCCEPSSGIASQAGSSGAGTLIRSAAITKINAARRGVKEDRATRNGKLFRVELDGVLGSRRIEKSWRGVAVRSQAEGAAIEAGNGSLVMISPAGR